MKPHSSKPNEIAAAMTCAKGLGDMRVDSVVNIAVYWRAQELLRGSSRDERGLGDALSVRPAELTL